ncbi:hypothetical protein [Dyella silvae]|uniref:hypothetical protein n=1 Tax=Dyella silvae TaxID=2994424 RepID=UPI0022646C53|nr:hypothetical protein [Dyella silvae]
MGILYRLLNKTRRVNFDKENDSEFAFFNGHFQNFLNLQHLMLTTGKDVVEFDDDQQKLRYLYFILGAADRLSRGMQDQHKAHVWWGGVGIAQGTVLFNDHKKAFAELKRYGDASNAELYNAGQKGWEALGIYYQAMSKDKTPEDDRQFQHSGLLLTKVVRGYPEESLDASSK